jgi:hypothetical protein
MYRDRPDFIAQFEQDPEQLAQLARVKLMEKLSSPGWYASLTPNEKQHVANVFSDLGVNLKGTPFEELAEPVSTDWGIGEAAAKTGAYGLDLLKRTAEAMFAPVQGAKAFVEGLADVYRGQYEGSPMWYPYKKALGVMAKTAVHPPFTEAPEASVGTILKAAGIEVPETGVGKFLTDVADVGVDVAAGAGLERLVSKPIGQLTKAVKVPRHPVTGKMLPSRVEEWPGIPSQTGLEPGMVFPKFKEGKRVGTFEVRGVHGTPGRETVEVLDTELRKRYGIGLEKFKELARTRAKKGAVEKKPRFYFDEEGNIVEYRPKGGVDFDRPIISPTPETTVGAGSGRSVTEQAVARTPWRKLLDTLKYQVMSPHRVLEKSAAGRYILDAIETAKMAESRFLHKYSNQLIRKTGRLNEKERAQVVELLEGKLVPEASEKVKKAAQLYRQAYEELWHEGVKRGIFTPEQKLTDYVTHIFDPELLLETIKQRIARVSQKIQKLETLSSLKPKQEEKLKALKQELSELGELAKRLSGGSLFSTQQRDFASIGEYPFALLRKGHPYYIKDIEQAYGAYVRGFARQAFRKPALAKAELAFKGLPVGRGKVEFLPQDQVRFINEYLKEWAGAHPLTPFEKFSGLVRGFEFARLLGLNPRSAVVNLMQQINNIAGLGLRKTAESLYKLLSNAPAPKEVQKYFDASGWQEAFLKSGLADEIEHQFVGTIVPQWLQKINRLTGFMFNKVEFWNKGTAWVGSLEKALKEGKSIEEALKIAYRNVRDWQFFYGKIGLPEMLRRPLPATLFQFWSYSIKQLELLLSQIQRAAKGNPQAIAFLARFFTSTALADILAQRYLGLNLNNALGLGIDTNELIRAFQSLNERDYEEMSLHVKRALEALNPLSGAPGILPTGVGPAISHLNLASDIQKQRVSSALVKHFTPLVLKRAFDFATSTKGPGYRILRDPETGMARYRLSESDMWKRLLFGKPVSEYNQQRVMREWKRFQDEERKWINQLRLNAQRGHFDKVGQLFREGARKGYDLKKARNLMLFQMRNRDITLPERMERKYLKWRR